MDYSRLIVRLDELISRERLLGIGWEVRCYNPEQNIRDGMTAWATQFALKETRFYNDKGDEPLKNGFPHSGERPQIKLAKWMQLPYCMVQ